VGVGLTQPVDFGKSGKGGREDCWERGLFRSKIFIKNNGKSLFRIYKAFEEMVAWLNFA
jgi:hypothetical protein